MAIGSLLVNKGVLTREALDRALAEQARSGERLDRVLVRTGLARREDVLAAVGEQFGVPVVDLASVVVDAAVLGALPPKLVFRQRCVPIARDAGVLTVATSDPFEASMLDELRLLAGCPVELALADEDELQAFIRAHYGVGGDTLEAMGAAGAMGGNVLVEAKGGGGAGGAGADELEQAQEASVIRLVNDVLAEAISDRATDVHIEPYEHELVIRYRIDGVLQRANVPPTIHKYMGAIVSRLKIMAGLNIAEKRRPQDGRITFRLRRPLGSGGGGSGGSGMAGSGEYDLRVSIIPMLHGEGVVLRVLSTAAVLMSLPDLGMPTGVLERWRGLIARPHGIVLVTGPTGSGKSTTLYASLNTIVTEEIKAITIEDPVEYHVKGVNQIQVNPKVGVDFAAGLRAILRHDPDIVMIGEIRDKETAEVAVQASLTGHLVFSTLHTNDACGAVTRLLDMGVEPFLVSSSLEGVMAQRLVRRVCAACAKSVDLEPGELPEDAFAAVAGVADGAGGAGVRVMRGVGCRACRNTGYRGRVGVYELLRMTETGRELVMHRGSAQALARSSRDQGALQTLREDGYAKVFAGLTTPEEVASALVS
jgi:general secretion pathway protein E/type IV pilus assembly protein PilB